MTTTTQRVKCLLGICQTCGTRRTFLFKDEEDLENKIKEAEWWREGDGLCHGWFLCNLHKPELVKGDGV